MDIDFCRILRRSGGGQIVHKFVVTARTEVLRALLRGDARPRIVFRDAVARHDALDPHLFRRSYGDGRVADRAKAALDELDGVKPDEQFIARRHAAGALARNVRADDGVQLRELFLVMEDDQTNGVHVHSAVRSEDRAAECLSQRRAQTFIAPKHFMVDPVAIEHARVLFLERAQQARLPRARAAGVATIGNIFLDPDRWRRRRGYFDAHPEVFFVLGIHPGDGQQCTPEVLADIREAFAVDDRLRALGEIGLDFYWDDCPKEIQYQVLHDQLQLARELEKPVVIHCRNAEAETLMTLESRGFAGYPLLWHCFGGDADMARRIIRNGWHISIPGPVSYPANKAVREALAVIPDDRLLLETDSPYLSPVPWRGKRNEPAFTVFTVRHMAAARGMEPEELWQLCGDNARRFFGL